MAERRVKRRDRAWSTEVRDFGDRPTANVGISLSRTIRIEEFESVKCDVSLHVPCLPEEVEETFEAVQDWVEGRLGDWVRQVEAAIPL